MARGPSYHFPREAVADTGGSAEVESIMVEAFVVVGVVVDDSNDRAVAIAVGVQKCEAGTRATELPVVARGSLKAER